MNHASTFSRAVLSTALLLASASCAVEHDADVSGSNKGSLEAKAGHGHLDGAGHALKLQKKLGLNDTQREQVERAFELPTYDERSSRIRSLLTADQATAYDALVASHPHHKKRGAAGHAEMFKEKLQLSDEQADRVQAVFTDIRPKMHALRKQKHDLQSAKEAPDRDAKLAALAAKRTALREEMAEQFRSILNADQYERWTLMRAKHHAEKGHECQHGAECPHHADGE